MKKEVISVKNAPAAIGPYSQGVKIGDLMFLSGMLPINPETGEMTLGIEAQTHQIFKNICAILEAEGCDFSNVLKATVFLVDLGDFAKVNEVYGSYFSGDFPARSCVEVSKLPKDSLVEVEVIVHKN